MSFISPTPEIDANEFAVAVAADQPHHMVVYFDITRPGGPATGTGEIVGDGRGPTIAVPLLGRASFR